MGDTVDMDTEDMDTEPEVTTMARGRPRPSLVTTRTGAMASGPEDTMVMAMDTVSTTDKWSDENCQSSIEFRCLNQFCNFPPFSKKLEKKNKKKKKKKKKKK